MISTPSGAGEGIGYGRWGTGWERVKVRAVWARVGVC